MWRLDLQTYAWEQVPRRVLPWMNDLSDAILTGGRCHTRQVLVRAVDTAWCATRTPSCSSAASTTRATRLPDRPRVTSFGHTLHLRSTTSTTCTSSISTSRCVRSLSLVRNFGSCLRRSGARLATTLAGTTGDTSYCSITALGGTCDTDLIRSIWPSPRSGFGMVECVVPSARQRAFGVE